MVLPASAGCQGSAQTEGGTGMRTGFKSERIVWEDGIRSGIMMVEDGRIAGLTENADEVDNLVDVGFSRIIPGIFDTHNHGTHGYGLSGQVSEDPQVQKQTVRHYLKALASQGVTSVFPTCAVSMIRSVSEVADEVSDGAQIAGIHSEGPWLNRVGEKGIKTGWPEVSLDTARKMVEDGQGKLKLVALAPEIPGIDPIIDYFLSQGVTLANAHSDNQYEQAMAAYARGITVATHTGNVMTGLHHRDIGGLGAALTNDAVECEVICDGLHISLDMLKLYFKIKDPSRFMMISDCSGMAGAPVGKYRGWHPGMVISVTPEGFCLSDTGRLCGSSKPVLYGIGNLVEKLGMPLTTVCQMASLNPARTYGIADHKGSLAIGKDADFAVISDDYQAICTYVMGRKVYDRQTSPDLFNPEFYRQMRLEDNA